MTIEKGQTVVSRLGFVFQVVSVKADSKGRQWVKVSNRQSGGFEHYLMKDFIGRFGNQLPKEKPKQGELL